MVCGFIVALLVIFDIVAAEQSMELLYEMRIIIIFHLTSLFIYSKA